MNDHVNRLLGWISALLMVGIAALAFIVSFEAIRGFAERSGAVTPGLAWAIPLLVDGTMVMASIVLFNRSLARERAWYPAGVLVLGAGGSLALNVGHSATSPAAVAISLIPPVALVLSVELAMSETRRRLRRSPEPKEAQEDPSVLVPGVGAGVDLSGLLEALSEASADGEVSGSRLAAALSRRGREISERDARRVLALLRPPADPGSDNLPPEPAAMELEPATI